MDQSYRLVVKKHPDNKAAANRATPVFSRVFSLSHRLNWALRDVLSSLLYLHQAVALS